MSIIHLVTTCSKSKNGLVGDTIFPYGHQDINIAFQHWKRCLLERYSQGNDTKETQHLYCGQHWDTAKRIAETHDNICLWVVSAGLGLRHISDPSIPYEASFTKVRKKSADLWKLLTANPVLPGRIPSLEELMRLHKLDTFVVAASPVYLNAIEHDLAKGLCHLYEPNKQLTITTTASYDGQLKPFVKYGNIGMMKRLRCNMTTLNIKHAESLIVGKLQNLG
ncbi:hypothetical protein JQ760_027830 (plasmid) [Klebsiella pneumoniae]|uniref:hypothetical protein n=1 Tax=Klebsiella pneumoniae TaxID=573 RepID=UPI001FAB41A3|nr:hypothetical protein [Klebsiella pneumoniae]MCI8109174.1 hypothetical protein [Klebsiella pneumoniae]